MFSFAVTMVVLVLTTKTQASTVASTASGDAPEAGELMGAGEPTCYKYYGVAEALTVLP